MYQEDDLIDVWTTLRNGAGPSDLNAAPHFCSTTSSFETAIPPHYPSYNFGSSESIPYPRLPIHYTSFGEPSTSRDVMSTQLPFLARHDRLPTPAQHNASTIPDAVLRAAPSHEFPTLMSERARHDDLEDVFRHEDGTPITHCDPSMLANPPGDVHPSPSPPPPSSRAKRGRGRPATRGNRRTRPRKQARGSAAPAPCGDTSMPAWSPPPIAPTSQLDVPIAEVPLTSAAVPCNESSATPAPAPESMPLVSDVSPPPPRAGPHTETTGNAAYDEDRGSPALPQADQAPSTHSDAGASPDTEGRSPPVHTFHGLPYNIQNPARLPRASAVEARQRIAQTLRGASPELSAPPAPRGGRGSRKRRHSSAFSGDEGVEDSDDSGDDAAKIKKRAPVRRIRGRPPRAMCGTGAKISVVRRHSSVEVEVNGQYFKTYSRWADYVRWACTQLQGPVQCTFCQPDRISKGNYRSRADRLPDAAYRHLEQYCKAFQNSEYFLENRAVLDPPEPKTKSRRKVGSRGGQRPQTKLRGDQWAHPVGHDVLKIIARRAVRDGKMVVQLRCSHDPDYIAAAEAYHITPETVRAHLKKYAAIYMMGDCDCCPYPSYSSYQPPT